MVVSSCISKKTRAEIEALAAAPHFDFYCWDLYARVSQWYAQDKQNLQARSAALHAIEEGNNETAAIADLISVAVLRRHLESMLRLDIEYDFLPRESEILHLHFGMRPLRSSKRLEFLPTRAKERIKAAG